MRLPFPNKARQPMPQFTVLTDRDDGTLWVLSHDETGEYVTITDQGLLVNPSASATRRWSDFIIYPPEGGPIITDPQSNPHAQRAAQKRLFVRGGYLGYEDIEDELGQGLVVTRRGMSRILREIFVPDTWRSFNSGDVDRDDDVLGYKTRDIA